MGWQDEKRRKFIYFGNWQRDYSQLVDPKIVAGLRWGDEMTKEWGAALGEHAPGLLAVAAAPLVPGAQWVAPAAPLAAALAPSTVAEGGDFVQTLFDYVCEPLQAREDDLSSAQQWRHPAQQTSYAWILPALVDVLAEDHFGQGFPERFPVVDSSSVSYSFGAYVPREHIDNPSTIDTDYRDLDSRFRGAYSKRTEGGIVEDPRDRRWGLRKYIQQSVDYIAEQIQRAAGDPPPKTGYGLDARQIQYMHFGNALHTLEDYFAHTNFCELLLKHRGYDVETYTEQIQAPPPHTGRTYAIATGTFGGLDTAMSLIGVLFHHLAQEEAEPNIFQQVDKLPKPEWRPSTASRIFLILLRRHCAPAAPLYSFLLSVDAWLALPARYKDWLVNGYRSLLRFLHVQLAWAAADVLLRMIVPRFCELTGATEEQQREAMKAVGERDVDRLIDVLMMIARLPADDRKIVRAAAQLVDIDHHGDVGVHLHPRDPEEMGQILEELVGLHQMLATRDTNEPTHTQLGKDHTTHPLHDLARDLAIWAVARVASEMGRAWEARPASDAARRAQEVVDRVMRHPLRYEAGDAAQVDRIVDKWVRDHADALEGLVRSHGETPLALDSLERKRNILINLKVLLQRFAHLAR